MRPHRKKNSVSKFLVRLLLVGAMCAFSLTSYLGAQPNPGGDPDVPISGIGLLLAAGAAYGAKKAYDVYRKGKQ